MTQQQSGKTRLPSGLETKQPSKSVIPGTVPNPQANIHKANPWLIEWVRTNPTIATPIVGLASAILGALLTVLILPAVRYAFIRGWDGTISAISGRRAENRYLNWVIRQQQFLPILPTTLVPITAGSGHHELDDLYVSLATDGDSRRGIDIAELLANSNKIVLLGDPGAGKTTTLRFLTLTLARARRKGIIAHTHADRIKEHKASRQARHWAHKTFRKRHPPLPILVYLNRLRSANSWDQNQSLVDFMQSECSRLDGLRDLPTDFFRKKAQRGECIFLFDALDELSASTARDRTLELIAELTNSISDRNLVIVSSRIVGYQGQLTQYGFRTVKILGLTWSLVQELTDKWYAALGASTLGSDLLGTLKVRPRLLELAVNPMLLSLIVLVQYVRGLIPDRRHILYEECVRILVERRFAPPAVQEEYNQLLPSSDAIIILRKLAFRLHMECRREIRRDELEALIQDLIQGTSEAAMKAGAPRVIDNIERRSQMLVERGYADSGAALMAFSHMTFQEYLTAMEFRELGHAEGTIATRNKLLNVYHSNPEWWEEVVLLYAAQLSYLEREMFLDQVGPSSRTPLP